MRLPSISSCDRVEFILSRSKGKSVLHLGCSDWPFTQERLDKGAMLHQRLATVASDLVGLDLEERGISMMTSAGINQLVLGNSEANLFSTLGRKFDVVVAGEILEHVLNAGLFLESISTVLGRSSILIVTTPNFAPLKRLPRLLWRSEPVHPNHVCYFSYSTLTKLLSSTGYEPIEWATYWSDIGRASRLTNSVLRHVRLLQYFADGFCVAARLREGQLESRQE